DVRTSRIHHRLVALHAAAGPHGEALIDGLPWDSPTSLARVKDAAGDDAWVETSDVLDRFDILPLRVATDGAVAAFGRDVRRLRPNIVIGGVHGLDERQVAGGELHHG